MWVRKRSSALHTWYGMVWYGMVWYGMVWYGMVWYGMVWYGMVWYGMVWYTLFKSLKHASPNNTQLQKDTKVNNTRLITPKIVEK